MRESCRNLGVEERDRPVSPAKVGKHIPVKSVVALDDDVVCRMFFLGT